ncbi:probable RING finger protein 207 homolog [Mytilus edulis]|uniref:probable RING finger protein 207 homolog n=1 Tax=Mytilus edulis TaxID=6550 RepID=UPI0039F00DCF
MASSEVFCTLCHEDGSSKDAVTWCTECEVFLCIDCEKHHQKSRMSKDHKTMPRKDYQKLPTFMKEISSQCKDHKKKFELYCTFHACPCCVQCLNDKHQKCQELKPLSDILENIKSSASVQLLEKDMTVVKENFEEMIRYLNSRMNSNNGQKLKAAETIRSFKKSIDEFLNKIEEEILTDLESKHSKLNSEMNALIQQLEQRANQISQMQGKFTEMTRLATELQMYVGLRETEKTTSQAEKYIETLKNEKSFDEKNLKVTISPSLLLIPQDVKSFEVININISKFTLQIKAVRKDQAQSLIQTFPGFKEKPSITERRARKMDKISRRVLHFIDKIYE